MRAITVRQPWAWAFAHGGKDVENRTRNIAGAYRGQVAVHAGKSPMSPLTGAFADVLWHNAQGWPPSDIPYGAVVAVVDLTGAHWCNRETPCPGGRYADDRCSPWAFVDNWHLTIANRRPLDEPVPCRGRLGLWTLPADIEAAVLAQIGDPS